MAEPRTLGEAVEQRGVLVAFDLIRQLAEKVGRIPVGFWTYQLADQWTLTVNGTGEQRENVPPYHALINGVNRTGWPIVALMSPADGNVIGGSQDDIEAALRAALSSAAPRTVEN